MKQNETKNRKKDVKAMTKDEMIELMKNINFKHTDNDESRKNALKTLMNGVQIGNKVFVMVPLEDLHIDESYQRSIQGHAKVLAQEWDNKKCDPLKINFRENGLFYVWDGQHRLFAMRIKGIDFALCVVTVGLTREQEAELFGCQGDGIKKPDPYDIFKANVCAGEEIDSAIKKMCCDYGLHVSRNSKKAGNLSCLTLVRKIFEKGSEDRKCFEWVLKLLHNAKWNEFPQSYCHRIINSLYEVRKTVDGENEFVQRKLAVYLTGTNPDELLVNATIKYPQFKDESKKLKLFLLDIVNGEEAVCEVIWKQGRLIA